MKTATLQTIYFQVQIEKLTGGQVLKMRLIFNKFPNIFSDIRCFEGTFSLQLKEGNNPYQASLRYVANVLQKPFKKELECLQ